MSGSWDAWGSGDWRGQSAGGMPVVETHFQSDLRPLMAPPHPRRSAPSIDPPGFEVRDTKSAGQGTSRARDAIPIGIGNADGVRRGCGTPCPFRRPKDGEPARRGHARAPAVLLLSLTWSSQA